MFAMQQRALTRPAIPGVLLPYVQYFIALMLCGQAVTVFAVNAAPLNPSASVMANSSKGPAKPVQVQPSNTDNALLSGSTTLHDPLGSAPVLPVELIRLFAQTYSQVKANYVEPVSDERLFNNAMHGLLTGLDPYSDFLDSKSYDSILEFTDGELARTGLVLKQVNDQWRIDKIEPDSPAVEQGLKVGDIITRIDGKSLKTLSANDIEQLLRGTLGSRALLSVSAPGQHSREVRILRRLQDINPVNIEVKNGMAILQVHAFQSQTGKQIQDALDPIYKAGNLQGIVLDLRDNPGGLLATAVEVADYFLDNGLIVYTRGRGEPEQRYQALSDERYPHIPMVVLINKYSASASEVLAGALQDHKRAVVMGQQSYGKGSVQKLWPIEGGRAIKLTVARYYTPNGRMFEGHGIEPDISLPVPITDGPDTVVDAALTELAKINLNIKPGTPVPSPTQPSPDRSLTGRPKPNNALTPTMPSTMSMPPLSSLPESLE